MNQPELPFENKEGLYPKYLVFKHPGEEWVKEPDQQVAFRHSHAPGWSPSHYHGLEKVEDFVFVLKPYSDPAAASALHMYMVSTQNLSLARDLKPIVDECLEIHMTPDE